MRRLRLLSALVFLIAGSLLSDSAHALTAPQAIYPSATYFVLPVTAVGGPITVTTLAPDGIASHIKPLSRTEYDIAHSPLYYRIDVFKSASDAAASLADQMAHLSRAAHIFHVRQQVAPTQYLYSVPGTLVLLALLDNVEIAANSQLAQPNLVVSQLNPETLNALVTLARALVARARAYPAAGNSSSSAPSTNHEAPIYPPAWVFVLPASVVGPGLTSHADPSAAYGRRDYDYGSSESSDRAPHFTLSYIVSTFSTISLAAKYYVDWAPAYGPAHAQHCPSSQISPTSFIIMQSGHDSASSMWARSTGMFQYRNLVIFMQYGIDNAKYSVGAAALRLQVAHKVASLMTHLMGRAQGYALHAPPNATFPSAPTPVPAAPTPAPTATAAPTPTAAPQVDTMYEYGVVASAEESIANNLEMVRSYQTDVNEGLLSPFIVANVAAGFVHTSQNFLPTLENTPMNGIYAAARPYLIDGLHNIDSLWKSVVQSKGTSFNPTFYDNALQDLTTAEQFVAP